MKTLCTLFAITLLASAGLRAETLTGEMILDGFDVSERDRAALQNGEVLAFDGEEYESTARELAADATVLVDSSIAEILDQVDDVPSIIPDKYLIEFVDVSSPADFEQVAFSDGEFDEADALLKARAGKDFNFSDGELQRIGALNKGARSRADRLAAASTALREILVNRYNAYQEKGLDGIGDYQRSKRKAISIGRDLRLTTETLEPFSPYYPEYYRVLSSYPAGASCCEHIFRLIKAKIRKRPTWALSHTIIQSTDNFLLITERHYYVTHTLNNVQVTMSWVPWDEDTQMGLAVSASTDILDSMMGRMLRPLGRNKARDLVSDMMTEVRDELQTEASGE